MTDNGSDHAPGEAGARVLAAFEDPEPLTAEEVAAATGLEESAATEALEEQVAAGRLGHRTVGDGIDLWYPTPGGGNGASRGTDTGDTEAFEAEPEGWDRDEVTIHGTATTEESGEFDETRVEAAVAELEVPGTSEMMRDWRRAAVRGAFDYVREEGTTDSAAVVEAVYPAHSAGYTDGEAWWDCVGPRLAELPGIDREDDRWEFVGDE